MYHEGELGVQARAGVSAVAELVGRSIRDFIPPSAMSFLPMQRLSVVGSVAADGSVWASALVGEPGFLSAPDRHTLRIAADVHSEDPLWGNLAANPSVGVLILDPATRRRMRVNGTAEVAGDGLLVHVQQVYSNCPQYIQQRVPRPDAIAEEPQKSAASTGLSPSQKEWIQHADTFFLATAHPLAGADASHRGGKPGFIQVRGDNALAWPDYSGNNMFQSLGNLMANPQAGLLFIDFEAGRTLQLTGTAKIVWDADKARDFPGAQRLLEFSIEKVIETNAAFSNRWKFLEYSPVNP
jgi:predicted pyridoxine 5'-phosphate oxidase superfamily flavin-nucleotide-binding protein